jgi:hypothetical protein
MAACEGGKETYLKRDAMTMRRVQSEAKARSSSEWAAGTNSAF